MGRDFAADGPWEKMGTDVTELRQPWGKAEFSRARSFESFEEVKEKLEEYIAHWNTRRRQVGLKGLTPEEFRSQSLAV